MLQDKVAKDQQSIERRASSYIPWYLALSQYVDSSYQKAVERDHGKQQRVFGFLFHKKQNSQSMAQLPSRSVNVV